MKSFRPKITVATLLGLWGGFTYALAMGEFKNTMWIEKVTDAMLRVEAMISPSRLQWWEITLTLIKS